MNGKYPTDFLKSQVYILDKIFRLVKWCVNRSKLMISD